MTQPAYQRIADDLRRQIADGALAAGDKIPSRAQLRERYGASDAAALQAVRLLTSKGDLKARSGPGRPCEVNRSSDGSLATAIGGGRTTSPFRDEMARQGRAGGWRVVSSTEHVSDTVTERPGIAGGDDAMWSRCTFLADGRMRPILER